MTKATIFEVAELAGVSIKTVSRVVNREPNVRPATAERVEKAIAKLNYRPDPSARNLASHRSHLIGLVYDDPSAYELPSAGYIINMQQGALRACRAALSELLIHPCNFREKDVTAQLKSLINETRPAGIVLAAPLSNMPKIIDAIEQTGTPFVLVSPGNGAAGSVAVVTDDREASAEMTRYLAALGHSRIAFIAGDPGHKAVVNRHLGYREGLEQSDLPYDPKLVAHGDNSFGSGEVCAEKLLSGDQPPTAIFAANDDMAAGVIRTADRMGVKIPENLSVAGFDDIALARQVYPRLTTIRQPLVEMTEQATNRLLRGKSEQPAPGDVIVVPATLKVRDSTGAAPE
jgi:LacI family transcriptional regulator